MSCGCGGTDGPGVTHTEDCELLALSRAGARDREADALDLVATLTSQLQHAESDRDVAQRSLDSTLASLREAEAEVKRLLERLDESEGDYVSALERGDRAIGKLGPLEAALAEEKRASNARAAAMGEEQAKLLDREAKLRESRDGMLRDAVRALEYWRATGMKPTMSPYLNPSACKELLRAAGFYGADQLEKARAALSGGDDGGRA